MATTTSTAWPSPVAEEPSTDWASCHTGLDSVELVHRACPHCLQDNQSQPDSPFSRGTWRIKTCTGCGFVYLQNVVPCDELVDTYSWAKALQTERRQRGQREPVFDFLSQKFKALRLKYLWHDKAPGLIDRFVDQGRVLDVGCGEGKVLRRLKPQLTPFGVEIDHEAATIARWFAKRRGGDVYHQDALSALRLAEDDFFDGVIMRSFLEHENEPRAVLEQTHRALKPGGRVILKVPNFASLNRRLRGRRWCGFRYPDHVNYFTPKTLVAMTQQAGLKVVCFDLRFRLPTNDNMWLIVERPT
jgi:SAM-dependent methyltransferase